MESILTLTAERIVGWATTKKKILRGPQHRERTRPLPVRAAGPPEDTSGQQKQEPTAQNTVYMPKEQNAGNI